MRLTRAQNVLRLAGNVQNRVAYDAPSDSLVVRGFLPSAIAASRLRRLQFPVFGGGIASITQGGIDATGYDHTDSEKSGPKELPPTGNRPTHDNVVHIEFPHISWARVNAVATKQELESRFGELKITAVGEYLRVLIKILNESRSFLPPTK